MPGQGEVNEGSESLMEIIVLLFVSICIRNAPTLAPYM
jgi:hypothetical protein